MKGRWRSKHEFRRVWECPVCRRRVKTSGSVVNLACSCLLKADPPRQTWMRLVEGPPERPARSSGETGG